MTNGGTSNPLGYCITPCHCSTSSLILLANFCVLMCCLLVKCAAASDGHTAHLHCLHTIISQLDTCSKKKICTLHGCLVFLPICRGIYFCVCIRCCLLLCLVFFVDATWRLLIPVDFFAIDFPHVYASIAHNFTNIAPIKLFAISMILQFVVAIQRFHVWLYLAIFSESTLP